MTKSSRHWDELELYRIKLYKWDKYMASIFPLLILTFFAYQVEPRPEVLWLGIGNSILIFISILYITPANFYLSKLVHFIAAFGVIFVSSIMLPFLRYEYFLMPLTMLTVFSTYPFQKGRTNLVTGILCVIAAIILFLIEINQTEAYPEYTQFNKVFQFILLYITVVEIIMTALIEKKYRDMIELDRNKMEEQKADLQKYIESNLQLENFAHLASHDLKTPLSNILRFSQLLDYKLKDKLTEEESELFDFIIKGSKRMNDTITSLFNFSQATNTKVDRSSFEFNHFVDEVLFDISGHVDDKEATVEVNTPKLTINADKVLFKQLWLNLILNAIKFAKPDEPAKINIHAHDAGDSWQFRIKDNGIGIAKEYLDNIFVIFKRLHSSDAIEGTGTGLAICKTIIEQHNGKIWADSDGSNGSSFHMHLPKS